MPFVRNYQITMEKSPCYFTSRFNVPKRILKFRSNMKFIIMIRNPVVRAVSHFTHDIKKLTRHANNATPLVAFNRFLLYRNGTVKNPPKHYLITMGMYVQHYKRWLKYFKKEQFLFLNGETFIKNPESELKKVEKFLNLKPFINKNHFVFDKKKGFFCMNKKQELNKTECMVCLLK